MDVEDEDSTDTINSGDLVFLEGPVKPGVLHSDSRIRILPDSLETGRVALIQCYRNLDAVPRVELVYSYRDMRNLAILGKRGIDKAEVVDQSVQLEGVAKQASICVEAETGNLYREAEGGYVLKSGPYMRRFLDGYYPFRVSLQVDYPADLLRFDGVTPAAAGLRVEKDAGAVRLDAWFEGRLTLEMRFSRQSE
jgi:hypothetical protein